MLVTMVSAHTRILSLGMTKSKSLIVLSVIYSQLNEQERSNSPNMENTPPTLCTASANVLNHFSSSVETNRESRELFSTQDMECLSLLVNFPTNVNSNRSMCFFFWETRSTKYYVWN